MIRNESTGRKLVNQLATCTCAAASRRRIRYPCPCVCQASVRPVARVVLCLNERQLEFFPRSARARRSRPSVTTQFATLPGKARPVLLGTRAFSRPLFHARGIKAKWGRSRAGIKPTLPSIRENLGPAKKGARNEQHQRIVTEARRAERAARRKTKVSAPRLGGRVATLREARTTRGRPALSEK